MVIIADITCCMSDSNNAYVAGNWRGNYNYVFRLSLLIQNFTHPFIYNHDLLSKQIDSACIYRQVIILWSETATIKMSLTSERLLKWLLQRFAQHCILVCSAKWC